MLDCWEINVARVTRVRLRALVVAGPITGVYEGVELSIDPYRSHGLERVLKERAQGLVL